MGLGKERTVSDTAGAPANGRVYVDKQSPKAYHALVQTADAVRATAAEAGLDLSLIHI